MGSLLSGCATTSGGGTQNAAGPAVGAGSATRTKLRPVRSVPGNEPVALQAGLPDVQASKDVMVAHFINVGQGDATLLEFSCGAVLIDTGGEKSDTVTGRDRLKDYLVQFFTRRADLAWTLNLVVLSHPHVDHTDGVETMLGIQPEITVQNVVDDGISGSHDSGIRGQDALRAHAQSTGAGYEGVTVNRIEYTSGLSNRVIDPIDCSQGGGVDPEIAALWGKVDLPDEWAKNANNDSVVLRVGFGSSSLLFTGDLEQEGIRSLLDAYADDLSSLDADVLKVGHHGSKNATTRAFLKAITPKLAVIQAGDAHLTHAAWTAWPYGHPNRVSIDLLADGDGSVSTARDPIDAYVGVRGGNNPEFIDLPIEKAIYCNCWDGNIAVTLNRSGAISVQTGY